MAVVASNLVLGAATLYAGTDASTEPTTATAALVGWTDLGGTTDGVTVSISTDYTELVVDQTIDRVGSRMTSRTITVSTNLAETTLANLKVALNGGTITTGSGVASFELPVASSEEPNYIPLIVEGIAPNGKKRRVVFRRCLQTGDVEFAYNKEDQTVYSVEFTAHYVDEVDGPLVVIDEVAV